MASTFIKFDTREIDQLVRRLNQGVALKPSDRIQLLKNLGAEIEDQTRERFSTKRAPDGDPWKDISEATRNLYERRGLSPDSPLVLSSQLRNTVETQVQNQWTVLSGATEEYAAVHQWGWEDRNIDARPYLGIGPQDEQALAVIATEFIQGLWERAS